VKEGIVRRDKADDRCGESCGEVLTERNRYFTGKYMTARDFALDHEYHRTRLEAHYRIFHGWGIACGLSVARHPNPECRDRWVMVRAGLAVDCCGHVLVLRRDTAFELPLPREDEEAGPDVLAASTDAYEEVSEGPFLLCLRYGEEAIESVPALYAEGTCDPQRTEPNRMREVARLGLCDLNEVEPGCWPVPGGQEDAPCRDDCDDDLPSPDACFEPDCPCGRAVPLALVSVGDDGELEIDSRGRRRLGTADELHTHITWISWPHGGEITLDELLDRDGRLEMRFDRRLAPSSGDAIGINRCTFRVQYWGVDQQLENLATPEEQPPGVDPDDECLAYYPIDPDYLTGRDTIAGSTLIIELLCELVPDCHGNPVAGMHESGLLPTKGPPGSRFFSCVRVTGRRRDEREE
jgi:hypothetical protein